jgi:DNA-binding NarL/FixJ family response regulator
LRFFLLKNIIVMANSALIVEDHPIVRDALLTLMQSVIGEPNVAATASSEEGLTYARSHTDLAIILLDLGLPGLNGIEAVASFKKRCPEATLIVISASEQRREVDAALRAGAKAFVSKAVSTSVIANLVQKVLKNEPFETTWMPARGSNVVEEEQMRTLTQRQRECLDYLCQGMSNKEIGFRMGVAEITIKTHISYIFRALNVCNRTQAVLTARRLGLYSPEESNS